MSTLDPGLEPPGDWQSPYTPPPTRQPAAWQSASVWVWVCSGIELLMSTCCTCSGLVLALVPEGELLKNMPADMPNREEVVLMMSMSTAIGIGMLVLGAILMLPAIMMSLLAFWVRSGSRTAAVTCMALLAIQGLVFSLLLVLMIVLSLRAGTIPDPVSAVIYLGLIALIGKTLMMLREALKSSDGYDEMMGPWGA